MLTLPEYSIEVPALNDAEDDSPPAPTVAPLPREKTLWPIHDLALVFVFICLLGSALCVAWQRSTHLQARERLIAELAASEEAFLTYLQVNGTAPADSAPGQVPPGMASYLGKLDWTASSSLGGNFRWSHRPPPPADASARDAAPAQPDGTIMLTAFPPTAPLRLSTADLLEIDRRLDDGDLTTGKFRAGFNGWPVLTVQAKR